MIFFKGYYGFQNFGDDLFVNIAEYICNKYFEDKPVFIGNKLPVTYGESLKINVKKRSWARVLELLYALFARKIIIFGGSTIYPFEDKIQFNNVIRKYRRLQRKSSTIGTSIKFSETNSNNELLIELLQNMEMVAVRDVESFNAIMKNNCSCYLSFDSAVIIGDVFKKLATIHRGEFLGVCPCLNRKESLETVYERLCSVLDKAIDECGIRRIKYFQLNGEDKNDLELCLKLKEHTDKQRVFSEIITYKVDTKVMCYELATCKMIFGSRLHSCIFAYSLGIPFMLEEYHRKCTDFLNTIEYNYRITDDLEFTVDNFKTVWNGNANGYKNVREFKNMFYKCVLEYKNECL